MSATTTSPTAATTPVILPASGSSTTQRVEQQLDDLDTLFAQIDAGEFTVLPLNYEWPANVKLSVVIPVYNEAATILAVVSRVRELPVPKEVIIVDDGSTDGTRERLEMLRGQPDVRVILKPRNEGKGAALRTGFETATGEVVIVQDADLEYEPADILQVVKPIVQGDADVVFGSRYLRGASRDRSFVHRLGNRLLTGLSNRLNRVRLTDMETCHKAFRREVLRSIELKQNRFGFEPEVTAKVSRGGYRIREVPIHYHPRGYAEGKKIGVKDLISTLWCIVRYGLGS